MKYFELVEKTCEVRYRFHDLVAPGQRFREVEVDLVASGVGGVVVEDLAEPADRAAVVPEAIVETPHDEIVLAEPVTGLSQPLSDLRQQLVVRIQGDERLELLDGVPRFRLIPLGSPHLMKVDQPELVLGIRGTGVYWIQTQEVLVFVECLDIRLECALALVRVTDGQPRLGPVLALRIVVANLHEILAGATPVTFLECSRTTFEEDLVGFELRGWDLRAPAAAGERRGCQQTSAQPESPHPGPATTNRRS